MVTRSLNRGVEFRHYKISTQKKSKLYLPKNYTKILLLNLVLHLSQAPAALELRVQRHVLARRHVLEQHVALRTHAEARRPHPLAVLVICADDDVAF